MPQLRVVVWNVQNLGISTDFRSAWSELAQFIAAVADNMAADVIMIEELRAPALLSYVLQHIQLQLNALNAPRNNWYYDWIKGAIGYGGTAPYATAADLDWDAAHHEGYAVFWNQNIAKFTMTRAPPIQPAGAGAATANTQSQTVRIQGVMMGAAVAGLGVPAGGIVTPALGVAPTPYTLPTGTNRPGIGVAGAPTPVAAGTVLPVGTVVGAGGVTVAAPTAGVTPVVIPGGFTLTDALTLPAAGAVLVPEHAVSLVMFGRSTGAPPATYTGDISGVVANYVPGAGPLSDWLYFTRGAGFPAVLAGARRPAYVTLDVNRSAPNNAVADRLTPIIAYHAPAAAPASCSGMQRASYSQPLYQAYDWAAGAWIACSNAMLGGDFNVATDSVAYAYNAYSNAFAAGGAAATPAIYNAAPPPPPAFPTRADNVLNKSMVAISSILGVQVYSANATAFRTLAIDNIFYRGLAGGVAAALYDLPDAVSGGGGGAAVIPGAVIQGFNNLTLFQQIIYAILTGGFAFCAPLVSGPSTVTDVQNGLMGFAPVGGNDTAARRAAEFVQLCVSDHLPVVLQAAM